MELLGKLFENMPVTPRSQSIGHLKQYPFRRDKRTLPVLRISASLRMSCIGWIDQRKEVVRIRKSLHCLRFRLGVP